MYGSKVPSHVKSVSESLGRLRNHIVMVHANRPTICLASPRLLETVRVREANPESTLR